MPRAEQWAERICTQLGKTVEAIFGVGRLLVESKADLPHGEWLRMFDEGLLPFKKSWAEMFMSIAEKKLLNSHDRGNLPPVVGTLYELSTVPDAQLRNAFRDGLITPDMKRSQVAALLPPKDRAIESTPAVESISNWSDEEEADEVRDALQPVRDLIDRWPDGRSLRLLHHEITQVVKYVERVERSNAQVSA